MTIEVLDCTLRDGGYYCNWDFDDALVKRYLDGIIQGGVHYIELGFRTRNQQGFAGKYKFCSEHTLSRMIGDQSVKVAVMIDGKDFISPAGEVAREDVLQLFSKKSQSRVDLVRITTTQTTLPAVLQLGALLNDLGYSVSANIMQASILSDENLEAMAMEFARSSFDVMYLADSFGGLVPERTRTLFEIISQGFPRHVGFHGHDNLGLAMANSLAAVDGGAKMVDCSLLGMGRGAGNLRTEQFLLYLQAKVGNQDVDPSPLFDVVATDFASLQQRYQWGTNLPYMLAAVHSVHPMYPQQLLQTYRYSSMEVVQVLETIRASGKGGSFSTTGLSNALHERFSKVRDHVSIERLERYRFGLPVSKVAKGHKVLLLGSGASVRQRVDDINEFIHVHQPLVVECNVQTGIEKGPEHFSLFTNHKRLEMHIDSLVENRSCAVLGMSEVSEKLVGFLQKIDIYHYPYRVGAGNFVVERDGCVIPHDVVAMFAFALALRLEATSIFLCGFDGYAMEDGHSSMLPSNNRIAMEREMEWFFHLLKQHEAVQNGVRVVSLTPTIYGIEQDSLYAYI
tara:strand:+ start:3132 stop:4829 length:1698 start_codon:yes stop_codon:yes gene_type:complete